MNVAPIDKPQLYDDDFEKKMAERMAERNKAQPETKTIEKGKGWAFKQTAKETPS